jgi:NitT/TauT family transport system substrate-binding protein
MNSKFAKLMALVASLLFVAPPSAVAEPLKVAYSDWPGFTLIEVAKQKGWFKEAGLEVELLWFDYLPSIDAFAAGKVDAVTVVAADALVTGATGAKSKFIAILDYSNGNDMIIGKPGINSIQDLKGKKVGLELTLVEHLLLLKALEKNGMKQSDVELVNAATNETPQVLTSGQVSAVGAWYPVSGQALKAVPGSKPLFTSADAPGLIYDVLAVNPASYAKRKADWDKYVKIYYRCVDFVLDPATRDEAVTIMAAKVGVAPDAYKANLPGTKLLTIAEALKVVQKGDGLDSIYGSLEVANKFNLDNKVYKDSQSADAYVDGSIIKELAKK